MKLIPYTEVDGQRNFKDSKIMSLYDRMVQEKTADTVFSDGTIQDREDFLVEMKSGRNRLHILIDEPLGEIPEPVAVVWLNRFEGKTARLHFCFFKKVWGQRSVEIGRFICRDLLSYQFNGEYIFDALIGRIPSFNKPAIGFFKRVGVKFVGEIPFGHWNDKEKRSESCFMVYMNREVLNEGL